MGVAAQATVPDLIPLLKDVIPHLIPLLKDPNLEVRIWVTYASAIPPQ